MKVDKATFPFTFERQRYQASVQMFTPQKTPMVRVSLERLNKQPTAPNRRKKESIPHPDVFIFWKVSQGELFWHDLHDRRKQTIVKKLADILLG